MPQATLTPGPGVPVRDSLAPVLHNATIASATTTTGAWVEVDWPEAATFMQATGTVTGTSVTIDTRIEGADDNSGTNLVVVGRFSTLTDTSDNVTRYLRATSLKRWYRMVCVTAGTSPSVPLTVKIHQKNVDWTQQSA